MKCAICGAEHAILDPAFRRPDAVVALPKAERDRRVKEDDDLCVIRAGEGSAGDRYFVRCTLQVEVQDREEPALWGLWAKVNAQDFRRIVERWSDPRQAEEPPMPASLANRVPGYPDTHGERVWLHLTGPTTRAALTVEPSSAHPFAVEIRAGVCTHRVMEWLDAMR